MHSSSGSGFGSGFYIKWNDKSKKKGKKNEMTIFWATVLPTLTNPRFCK
jgi:hypothetical protein